MRPGRRLLAHRLQEDESGAVLVLVTIILAVMIMMVALVVDISALRGDRRDSSKTADLASVAGVQDLLPAFGGSPQDACVAAWEYTVVNTAGIPAGEITNNPCNPVMPDYTTCDPTVANPTPNRRSRSVGDYTVTISWPVPDDDPAMGTQSLDSDVDGNPCERLAVQVDHARDFGFARVGGFTGATAGAPAVARATVGGDTPQTVALVVLDPHGTRSLCAAGKGGVWVKSVEIDGETHPGLISVDSDESVTDDCDGDLGDYAIFVKGNAGARIQAGGDTFGPGNATDGHIFSYALQVGEDGYDPGQVPDQVEPEPEPGRRATRQFMDDRYLDEITKLQSFVGSTGAPDASFQQYTAAGHPCTIDTDISLAVGNWWIDCPGGLTIQSSGSLAIPDGNVVFDGSLIVKGVFTANTSQNRWFYLRSGGDFVKEAQATITLGAPMSDTCCGTFVHLFDGKIDMSGGDKGVLCSSDSNLCWYSPFTAGPDGRDFEDLALWSESPATHNLAGEAGLDIEGTFFTPNADPFDYNGQGTQAQTKAQFVTHRLLARGQGVLAMEPDPSRSTPPPILRISLIR